MGGEMWKYLCSSILIVASILTLTSAESLNGSKKANRQEKLLPVFQVIQFKNEVCTATSDNNGTCYSANECSNKGGTSSGSCASGFGVCCIFSLNCGGSSSENCTYLESSKASTTNDGNCAYTICKFSHDICRIRFDFQTFDIADPYTFTALATAASTEGNGVGDCLTDSFSITAPGHVGSPLICGTNTGQHMIMDASDSCHVASFNLGASASTTRSWKIKIIQYECGDEQGGPENCLQYFTGTTGKFSSYNYPTSAPSAGLTTTHLSNQLYNFCFRQENGYCTMCYTVSASIDFGLSTTTISENALVGSDCVSLDYLTIPGGAAPPAPTTVIADTFCGQYLAVSIIAGPQSVCTSQRPFRVTFKSGSDEVTTGTDQTGNEGATSPTGGHSGFYIYYIQAMCS